MTTVSARATGGTVAGSSPTGRTTPEARLLVVDDEHNIRELLSASLRYAGF
jgi:two-component system, OmpR family, response regulator